MPLIDDTRAKINALIGESDRSLISHEIYASQSRDELDIARLFLWLVSRWKLVSSITLVGTLLITILALMLPNIYRPVITVSVPMQGDIAPLVSLNTLLQGNGSDVPSTPQSVFNNYYKLLRSELIWAEFIREKNYLGRLYPENDKSDSVLLADLFDSLKVAIEEPTAERKDDYIANPQRVRLSIDVSEEAAGVDLLNSYLQYANQRLISGIQDDVRKSISNKIETYDTQVSYLRQQHKQQRLQQIEKIEQDNAENIAHLEEQISALLQKAKADRITQIANAKEALEMAKSLEIRYPTTYEALSQKSGGENGINTAISINNGQSSLLYLQGEKYLAELIATLTGRASDAEYLEEINNLRQKIYLIKNDQALLALKNRLSDDPWIPSLPQILAQINDLKNLNIDISSVSAYSLDKPAIISDHKIKPRRTLVIVAGFVLSLFVSAIFAMIADSAISLRRKPVNNY